LQLEDLEATATEDALAAEQAAQDKTSTVRAFTRRKPVRKPFPSICPASGWWSRPRPAAPAAARTAS